LGFAEGIRSHIIAKLKQSPCGDDERAIVQTLLLGQKKQESERNLATTTLPQELFIFLPYLVCT
jgi:hypothetical protein